MSVKFQAVLTLHWKICTYFCVYNLLLKFLYLLKGNYRGCVLAKGHEGYMHADGDGDDRFPSHHPSGLFESLTDRPGSCGRICIVRYRVTSTERTWFGRCIGYRPATSYQFSSHPLLGVPLVYNRAKPSRTTDYHNAAFSFD